MKLWRKIAIGIACLAVVCGAAILWRAHQRHALSEKIIAATRARAAQGDPKAQSKLASIYYYGKGVPQDYAEALRWYRKAADQGYAEAQYSLGTLYYYGKGVPQDYGETARWYRKAANQGYKEAQFQVGEMYCHGRGVQQ